TARGGGVTQNETPPPRRAAGANANGSAAGGAGPAAARGHRVAPHAGVGDDTRRGDERGRRSRYALEALARRLYEPTSSNAAAREVSSSHTATGMPARSNRPRDASRRSRNKRSASAPTSPYASGRNTSGEISTTTRSKPRPRRSSSAASERSSSSGDSASTSACGGNVPRGTVRMSRHA